MQTKIINVKHPLLKDFIQSFIFFKTGHQEEIGYTTFPNTNLCLAIYKQNKIDYIQDTFQNKCEISLGKQYFQSCLYGFHEQPFGVKIKSALEQICILFQPGALRAFSNEPFEVLLGNTEAFDRIFPNNRGFLERLFNDDEPLKKCMLLEEFLVSKIIKDELGSRINEAIFTINSSSQENLKVDDIASKLSINSSTLYRLFYTELGQSPKAFLQTVRFRKALNGLLLHKQKDLTTIAYHSEYYDQAHFIKNIRDLTGTTPGKLRKSIAVEQGQLAWVCSAAR